MTALPPRPRPTPTTQPFWDALADERLRLQRCEACGAWVHYPRVRCPGCLSDQLDWCDVEPVGTVHTFTVARAPTAPPFAAQVPQYIAVIELANGVRLTSTLVDVEGHDLHAGTPVQGVFDHGDDGVTLLRFRPSAAPTP